VQQGEKTELTYISENNIARQGQNDSAFFILRSPHLNILTKEMMPKVDFFPDHYIIQLKHFTHDLTSKEYTPMKEVFLKSPIKCLHGNYYPVETFVFMQKIYQLLPD
jgi:hypothetical protein